MDIFFISLPTFVISYFFESCHPNKVRWQFTVILIGTSLMMTEHLLMYLLAICISLEECVFSSSAHFFDFFFYIKKGVFLTRCLLTLEINPLSVILFAKLSPSCRLSLCFIYGFVGRNFKSILWSITSITLFHNKVICIDRHTLAKYKLLLTTHKQAHLFLT